MATAKKTAKKTASNAPAKKEETAISTDLNYGEYASEGYENQDNEDRTLPFMLLLQALSPQIETMDNAKPGMLYNSVTQQLVDGKQGIRFIPAVTEHVFVEWVPDRGGFVAVHSKTSDVVKQAKAGSTEFGKFSTKYDNGKCVGNDLVETFYVYAVILDEDDNPVDFAIFAFTSTKIKTYKRWNTRLSMFTLNGPNGKQRPPLFAHKTIVKSVKEKNGKGQEYYNYDFTSTDGDLKSSLLPPGHPALDSARELKDMVLSGEAKVDHSAQASEAGGEKQAQAGEEGEEPEPF